MRLKPETARIAGMAAMLMLAGCGAPQSLLDAEVRAGSSASFLHWRGRVLETYPKPERAEFEAALQDLRYAEMGGNAAMSGSMIDARVRERVNGRTVRDVLAQAYEARWKRVDEELRLVRGVIELNLAKAPLTTEGEARLNAGLDRQISRQDELSAELARIEARLEELGVRLPPPVNTAPSPPLTGRSSAAAS